MRVWLINTSEPLPIDDENVRLRRVGILANTLAENGHEVVWWTSTFDHWHKRQRFETDTTVELNDLCRLRLLHAAGYRKNISLGRIRNHRLIGGKFKAFARTTPAPDVILCSFPTLDTSVQAVRYGEENGVPVVLDIRDLWPDVFVEMVPQWVRPVGKCLLRPMYQMARSACAGAFAITGNSPAFVQWGLSRGNRRRTEHDRDFPFAYSPEIPNEEDAAKAREVWKGRGVDPQSGAPIICFFGSIGYHFDFATVIEAARRIEGKRDVQFVICGVGDRIEHYRTMAEDCHNVLFPGWINAQEIWELMQLSSLALAPYVSNTNFEGNLTNKPIEYFAGGVPVLTSLKNGVLPQLLAEHDCGISYGDNPQKLMDVILALSQSPERREKMARNALRLFETRFTASRVYGEMTDYLEQIARRARADRQRTRPGDCIARLKRRPR